MKFAVTVTELKDFQFFGMWHVSNIAKMFDDRNRSQGYMVQISFSVCVGTYNSDWKSKCDIID